MLLPLSRPRKGNPRENKRKSDQNTVRNVTKLWIFFGGWCIVEEINKRSREGRACGTSLRRYGRLLGLFADGPTPTPVGAGQRQARPGLPEGYSIPAKRRRVSGFSGPPSMRPLRFLYAHKNLDEGQVLSRGPRLEDPRPETRGVSPLQKEFLLCKS